MPESTTSTRGRMAVAVAVPLSRRMAALPVLVLFITMVLVVAACLGTPVSGQEPPTAPPPAEKQENEPGAPAGDKETGETNTTEAEAGDASEPQTLEAMLEKFKGLATQMDELEENMLATTDPTATRDMRTQFTALNDEAKALTEQIEDAAVARLEEGNRDQSLLELLTGLIINHASFEREQEALDLGNRLIKAGIDAQYFEVAATADRLLPEEKEVVRELVRLTREAAADDLPRVRLTTTKGDIVLELFENEAPQTVGNFVSLVESGFYDGLTFHRVIDGFMAQGGDPKGDGTGGPGYNIYCECYKSDIRLHFPGYLSMAKQAARDTGGSQFFITYARTAHLDGKHTVFGRVVEGMDVANSLQRVTPEDANPAEPDRIIKAEVIRKRDHEYKPVKVGEDAGNQ